MIQVVKTVDVNATLLAIEVGMQVMCPWRLIDKNVLKVAATRLKKSGLGEYKTTTCKGGLIIRRSR